MKMNVYEDRRWCSRCAAYHPASEFWSGSSYCKAHQKEYTAARYDPRARQDRDLRKNYGITLAQYEAMYTAQGGVCAACGQPERVYSKRAGRLRYLAVDHDHTTGKVRALLCQECNTALGSLHDDPTRIRALLAYAEQGQQEQAA